jgi:flagellin
LQSALSSIEVAKINQTSSLSTIKDADIAEESTSYIQKQIIQNAASTLLATANQTPSIALDLI